MVDTTTTVVDPKVDTAEDVAEIATAVDGVETQRAVQKLATSPINQYINISLLRQGFFVLTMTIRSVYNCLNVLVLTCSNPDNCRSSQHDTSFG